MHKSLVILFALFGASAHAASVISCTLNAAINSTPLKTQTLTLVLDGDGDCARTFTYTVPGTQMVLTLHGHGACNPSQGMCPDVGASIDGIEAYDSASGTYSKTYGGCTTASPEMNFQLEIKGPQPINAVMACQLK